MNPKRQLIADFKVRNLLLFVIQSNSFAVTDLQGIMLIGRLATSEIATCT